MAISARGSVGRFRCRGPAAAPMPWISRGGERRKCFSTIWWRSWGGRSRSRERGMPGIAAIKRREVQISPLFSCHLCQHVVERGARREMELGEPPPQDCPKGRRQGLALAEVDDEKLPSRRDML